MKAQKKQKTITRLTLARRLQAIALAIAADQPIRIGQKSVRVPDRVAFEEELETTRTETELEFELTWSTPAASSSGTRTGKSGRRKSRA